MPSPTTENQPAPSTPEDADRLAMKALREEAIKKLTSEMLKQAPDCIAGYRVSFARPDSNSTNPGPWDDKETPYTVPDRSESKNKVSKSTPVPTSLEKTIESNEQGDGSEGNEASKNETQAA